MKGPGHGMRFGDMFFVKGREAISSWSFLNGRENKSVFQMGHRKWWKADENGILPQEVLHEVGLSEPEINFKSEVKYRKPADVNTCVSPLLKRTFWPATDSMNRVSAQKAKILYFIKIIFCCTLP